MRFAVSASHGCQPQGLEELPLRTGTTQMGSPGPAAVLQLPTHRLLGWPGPRAEQQKGTGPSGQATLTERDRNGKSPVSMRVCENRRGCGRGSSSGWTKGWGTLGTHQATLSGMGSGCEAGSASGHPQHAPHSTEGDGNQVSVTLVPGDVSRVPVIDCFLLLRHLGLGQSRALGVSLLPAQGWAVQHRGLSCHVLPGHCIT